MLEIILETVVTILLAVLIPTLGVSLYLVARKYEWLSMCRMLRTIFRTPQKLGRGLDRILAYFLWGV